MPDPETQGFIARYGGTVFAIIVGIGATVTGWLFKRVIDSHDSEITAIKKKLDDNSTKLNHMATKDDLERHRLETKEGMIAIHNKIEANATAVHNKIDTAVAQSNAHHDDIMKILLQQRERRRANDP